MDRPTTETSQCPTRADGDPALIAHRITRPTCQERQRRMYHKCPSCAHYNARLAVRTIEPPRPRPGLVRKARAS